MDVWITYPLHLQGGNNTNGGHTMTYNQFIAECTERTIDPELAKDNDLVVLYLAKGLNELVLAALDSEF